MKKIKKMVDNIYKISASATLSDIYQAVHNKALFVEPLSAKQTLKDFIIEGGTGFNSLQYGRLGKSICEISAVYDSKQFTYGLPFTTLYAAGYPLQRIIEGSHQNTLLNKKFQDISYVTAELKENEKINVLFKQSACIPFSPSPVALNAFFVNRAAAKVFGVKEAGFCSTIPAEYEIQDGWQRLEETVWEKRFFLDSLENTEALRIFTQQSTIVSMFDEFNKSFRKSKSSFFFALYTRLGVLLTLSGNSEELSSFWNVFKESKLTFKLI